MTHKKAMEKSLEYIWVHILILADFLGITMYIHTRVHTSYVPFARPEFGQAKVSYVSYEVPIREVESLLLRTSVHFEL